MVFNYLKRITEKVITIVRTTLLYLADLDTQKLAEFVVSFQDDFLETKVPKFEEKTSANLTAVASFNKIEKRIKVR